MQSNSLLLFGSMAIALITAFTVIVYMFKQKLKVDALQNETIEYYKDQLDELEWQYDRKCMAYKVFVITGGITSLCVSISIYIYSSGNHLYPFHAATLISLALMLYYNYLNREALLKPVELKRI